MESSHDTARQPGNKKHRATPLVIIGVFKLFKAALLLVVGFGALKLLHRDVAEQLEAWLSDLRLDPGSRYFYAAIRKLDLLDDRKLKQISAGAFVYALLFTIEGVGLCLRKRWAEYLTTVITASLLPLEILEVSHRFTTARVLLLLANVAVVAYLAFRLIRDRPSTEKAAH